MYYEKSIYHEDKRNCVIYVFNIYLPSTYNVQLHYTSHFIEHNADHRTGVKQSLHESIFLQTEWKT